MGKPIQTATRAQATAHQAPKVADVAFPGGAVRVVDDQRLNMLMDPPNGARVQGGSDWPAFNQALLETVMAAVPTNTNNVSAGANRLAAAAAALAAFKPADEIEAMIAGQCVALHFGAMECFRRAMLPDQHPEAASKLRRDGANLARAMTDMLDALDRKRGKVSSQTFRVERVTINDGGRAVIGNVAAVPDRG
jgi:hypothetical protein